MCRQAWHKVTAKRTDNQRTSLGIDDMTETLLETPRRWSFSLEASTVNPDGVRLQSDAALAPRQPVGLLLTTEPDCFIKARVVWVGKADSAQAGQAGFEFLNPLTGPVL